MKRWLSLILALTLAVVLLPMAVRAEEAAPETENLNTVIPFQVNPLYEGVVTEDDFVIPEFAVPDPNQATTQAVTYQTIDQAAEKIRGYMKSRTETFTIYVEGKTSNYESIGNQMVNAAMVHTGDPEEGDYLMWQFGGWTASVKRSYNSDRKMYEFTYDFAFVYYTTAEQEQELDTAITNLISELGVRSKSDYEKVSAVYDWICENVTYDYANLEDTSYMLKHTAYAAMMDKTAVCQGYALLFYRMMLELDVDNRLIAGLAASGEAHGWNIVQLGDYYYSVDATWDAGQEEYSYFLTSTWNFGGHYRFLDYETWEFHEEYPMAAEDYDPNGTAEIDPYIYVGVCGDDAYWLLCRDGSLEIAGTGSTVSADYDTDDLNPEWEYWGEHVTSLTVGEGITEIGDMLCYGLENLEEVTLPGSVTKIGRNAFYSCRNLKKLTLSEGLVTIGDDAFMYCTSLEALEIPSTVTTISYRAFFGCDSLTEVTIPASVTSLGREAFRGCDALHTVNLDIPTVPKETFNDCSSLVNIILSENVKTIEEKAFDNCDALTNLNIPGTVESLNGFSNCDGLTTLTLNEGLVEIGARAFENCTSLTGVTFPGTVTKLGGYCFANCDAIKEVRIPKNLTESGERIFYDCDGLITVYLYCNKVSYYAFADCDILRNIILSGLVKTIAPYAFDNCDGLVNLNVPKYLESLSGFSNCDKLANVTLAEGLKEIGEYAFQNCASLADITIPGTVERVDTCAFDNCDLLTEVTIPASVTYLTGFSNCDNLTTVNFSEGLVELGECAFQNCGALRAVELPDSLLYMGTSAFGNCDQFTTMELPENLVKLSGFDNCDNLAYINIPASVQEIGVSAFLNCKAMTQVDFPGGLKTIGENAFESCTGLMELDFPDGLETIDDNAFRYCSGLTEITIPESVTYLSGFAQCANLHTATLYNGGRIGDAFTACGKLQNVYLLGDVTKIGSEAFRYCDSLCYIELPATLTEVHGFYDCPSLQTVVVNGSPSLGFNAFYNCPSLRNLIINGKIKTINGTFDRCSSLDHLTFPEKVTTIRNIGTYGAETVTFLADAPEIYASAFSGRTMTIYYPANNSTWDDVAGQNYGGTLTWIPIGKPQRLEVVNGPTVTSYAVGDTLNLDGILLKATYADGTERDVHMCDLEIVSCDMSSAGQKTAKVSCQGVTATFPVYVHETGMTVKLDPATYPSLSKGTSGENTQTISCPGAGSLVLVFKEGSDVDAIGDEMIIYNQDDQPVLYYSLDEISGTTVVVPGDTAKIYLEGNTSAGQRNYSFDAIYALDFVHNGSGGSVTPATCTEEGFIVGCVCEICGIETADQVIPALGHDYVAVVTKPTCTEQGYTTHDCSRCDESYVDTYVDPIDHSYVDGVCEYCGQEGTYAKFVTTSASLGGNIAMNFYAVLSEDVASDPNAYVRFTFAGRTIDVPVSQGIKSVKNGVTQYRFSCAITAKNMTDPITAQVYNADGPVGPSRTNDIMSYSQFLLENTTDPELHALLKALLNYGAACQVQFNYHTDALANAILSEEDKVLADVDASAYAHSVTGSEEGIKIKVYSLLVDSETVIRIYFELTGEKTIDEFDFTVDGKAVKPTASGKYYYIQLSNVGAHKLSRMYTFTCGDMTITYGAMSYVNQVLNNSNNPEPLVNVAKALYAYSEAAKAYIS